MKKTCANVIGRILVALDAPPSSLAALQTAADLAAKMEAELLGLAALAGACGPVHFFISNSAFNQGVFL